MGLTLLVADDHTLVRQAVRRLLECVDGWRVVAEASTGEEAVTLATTHLPDVALLDLTMPGMSGIEAIRHIRRQAPSVRILVLTMHSVEPYINQALKAGARGYVVKDAADADLIQAVAATANGGSFLSPAAADLVRADYVRRLTAAKPRNPVDRLSEREREVFQLVAEGRKNRDIADLLEIAPTTVETHRARILEKLDVHSTAELIRCAAQQRVIA